MLNFEFYNPVRIVFGRNQIAELSNLIPKGKRVLAAYGGGSIKRNKVYNQVMAALKDYKVFEFGGIEPNPQYKTLMKAVQFVKKNNLDFIVAVGGGSVIDGVKFISAASCFTGEPWDIIVKKAKISRAIPFGTILTLPATGSEMNDGSVVSRAETGDKLAFISPLVFPKFSILDPTSTFSLPPKQTANGIIDAFVHVMEQYLTYPVNAPLQDRMAEGILATLIEEGPKALQNPNDYDARANIMWCSTMALNRLIGMGVPSDWASHRIGHPLTTLHGLDHGQTLAVIFSGVMEVRREQKREKLLQYGERVLKITSGTEERRIQKTIDKTREFFESLGAKTHLSDYGIGEATIFKVLAKLEEHSMTALGERQDIDLPEIEKILRHCL